MNPTPHQKFLVNTIVFQESRLIGYSHQQFCEIRRNFR